MQLAQSWQTTCRSFNCIDASDCRKWCAVGMNAMRLDKRYPDSDRAKGMRKWISSSHPSTLHISKVNFRNNRCLTPPPPKKKEGGVKGNRTREKETQDFSNTKFISYGFSFNFPFCIRLTWQHTTPAFCGFCGTSKQIDLACLTVSCKWHPLATNHVKNQLKCTSYQWWISEINGHHSNFRQPVL